MLSSPLRRKSSKCSSRELMNQENIDQARKSKRGRTFSILGSILKKTSTVSGSGGDSATNKDSAATMSQSPSRTFAPKVFNFVKHGRGKQRILETMDQNTIAIDMTPDAEELEDIDDEELFKDNATIIPIPYVDQEESLGLFSPPTPKSNAQPNAVTVVDSGLRDDSSLSLELKYGPYYEVWDPRENDQFAINGRITYRPHSPSKTDPQMSHLIYLSVDTFLQRPRKPIRGNPEIKYLKLVENSTVLELDSEKSESTTTDKERHLDQKTLEEKSTQLPQQRKAFSSIVGLLSPHSTLDLQVKPIIWNRGNQVCTFRLTLPVADPFLFPDNGAGDVLRIIKVRVRGVIRVLENGRMTVGECFVEEDIVVDVLKKTVLMDN